ncbi:alkaline phosphatase PhoX [Frankia sp. AvcI1]|uniref:alkaline phosphatase PhoX n=1 Tax=Frankia sp. AvcI1 TaxID=573496 RepID=UPI0006EC2AE1|nr:alkaline phosphatase PhoX [Frankia sp. AvcI1]
MDRRTLLRSAVAALGTAAFSGATWRAALAATARPGVGPYGPLRPPDRSGVALPGGFTSRIVARSHLLVGATEYVWHDAPDGGACFPGPGGGWTYVSNSEVMLHGGASALRFRADGTIASAGRILGGTTANCAGGATPWGTWLSCEEFFSGRVYEAWPDGSRKAVARPALGRFAHEAAACDPDHRVIYLTEDRKDGCFYRFRPDRWGELSAGRLEVLVADAHAESGPVRWERVPDPDGFPRATRRQVRGARRFNGGEGCWYAHGVCYLTTKGDDRVWAYRADAGRLDLVYDRASQPDPPPLTGVDNVVGARSGDLYVAEDHSRPALVLITPDGVVAPFLRLPGHDRSEITGPAFSPDGSRLYFSSQRGVTGRNRGGITFEVTGPFRR